MREKIARVAEYWALAAGVILLAIVAVTTTNVGAFTLDRIARMWGANVSGLPGYEDFVELAVSCAALMLLPWCQVRKGHIAVDLFARAMPHAVRAFLERLWLIVLAILAVTLAVYMFYGMLESRSDNALSRILGWHVWPFYIPGILSLLLWAGVAATQVAGEPE